MSPVVAEGFLPHHTVPRIVPGWTNTHAIATTSRCMGVAPRTVYRLLPTVDICIGLNDQMGWSATTDMMVVKANSEQLIYTDINCNLSWISRDGSSTGTLYLAAVSEPPGRVLDLCETATGWSAGANVSTISTTTSSKIGTYAVSYNVGSALNYGLIWKDFSDTAASMSPLGFVGVWVYVPDVTNLTSVQVLVGRSPTASYSRTQTLAVANLAATAWAFVVLNMQKAEQSLGIIDWTVVPTYVGVSFISSTTQTHSGCRIDHVMAF